MEGKTSAISRRRFIATSVPVCAVTCLLGNKLFAMVPPLIAQEAPQSKHAFDRDYDKKLTYRQYMRLRYAETMNLMKALEQEMGKDPAVELLKKSATERWLKAGKAQAEKSPDNSLNTYVEQFRGGYENTLAKEIVEDSPKAFELKITECIWASTFLEANMGDFGYAWVCWGDYAWATGFNPKIKLVRDKTLMQGHDRCNHRYVFEG